MVNGNILSRNDDFNGKLYTCQPHKVFYTLLEFLLFFPPSMCLVHIMFIAIMMTINSKFLCTDLVSQVGYTEIERGIEEENGTKREYRNESWTDTMQRNAKIIKLCYNIFPSFALQVKRDYLKSEKCLALAMINVQYKFNA